MKDIRFQLEQSQYCTNGPCVQKIPAVYKGAGQRSAVAPVTVTTHHPPHPLHPSYPTMWVSPHPTPCTLPSSQWKSHTIIWAERPIHHFLEITNWGQYYLLLGAWLLLISSTAPFLAHKTIEHLRKNVPDPSRAPLSPLSQKNLETLNIFSPLSPAATISSFLLSSYFFRTAVSAWDNTNREQSLKASVTPLPLQCNDVGPFYPPKKECCPSSVVPLWVHDEASSLLS